MKKYQLAILTILMLLAVGCQQQTKKDTETVGSPFIGGDKGLIVEYLTSGVFSEADNIEELFVGETFPLEVTFKNKGEADIDAGKAVIKLSGVELTSFQPNIPSQKTNTLKLDAVSEFNKQGGEETLKLDGPFLYTGPLTGNHIDLSFFAKIEYLYKTTATAPKICLKGDLNDQSVCKVDETKQVFSSAAPVQVKSAVEKSAGIGRVSVEFEIQNVGSGKVTLPEPDAVFDNRYDQLAFSASPVDKWECRAGGNTAQARLDPTGKATIVCRLKTELQKTDLFIQELGLTLNYKYRDIVHKQLRIKKQQ